MNQLPKSWAVKNDFSLSFRDTVIKYLRDQENGLLLGTADMYYGINKEQQVSISSKYYNYGTILSLQEFIEMTQGIPEKWCIKGSEEFKIWAYPNTNVAGNFLNYYYYTNDKDLFDWDYNVVIPKDYKEITFKQFKQHILKDNKTQLLGLPVIHGEAYHLEAFGKDCNKFGYNTYESQLSIHNTLALNGNCQEAILSQENSFKTLFLGFDKTYSQSNITLPIKTFNLPQDWTNALKFMEDNMKLWLKIQEENKKPVVPVYQEDDIVIASIRDTQYIGRYKSPTKISDWYCMHYPPTDYSNGGIFSKIDRFATKQEINTYTSLFTEGSYVVFLPEYAKRKGLYTECWNKPYILKVDSVEENCLIFSAEEMTRAGYFTTCSCSNNLKCFRPATEEEIKSVQQFKVGDWIYYESAYHKAGPYQIAKIVANGEYKSTKDQYHDNRGKGNYRLATKEEIEEYLNKSKVFTIKSSNGDFEVEVSKKGIYYKADDKWLPTEVNWNTTFNGYFPYEVTASHFNIGYQKEISLDQLNEVYNYYKSL